jgi:hypothetical protein
MGNDGSASPAEIDDEVQEVHRKEAKKAENCDGDEDPLQDPYRLPDLVRRRRCQRHLGAEVVELPDISLFG